MIAALLRPGALVEKPRTASELALVEKDSQQPPLAKRYSLPPEPEKKGAGGKGAACPLGEGGSTACPPSDAGVSPFPPVSEVRGARRHDVRRGAADEGAGRTSDSLIHEDIEKKRALARLSGLSTNAAGEVCAEYWAADVEHLARLGWHMVNQARRLKAKGARDGST